MLLNLLKRTAPVAARFGASASIRNAAVPAFKPFVRSFSTAPEPQKEGPSLSTIVNNQGGWYPLAGLTAAALISNEVILMDEELLMATNFAAAFTAMYIVGGDAVKEELKQWEQQIKDDRTAAIEFQREMLSAAVNARKNSALQVEVLQNLKIKYNEMVQKAIHAGNLKAWKAAQDGAVERVTRTRDAERSADADEMATYREWLHDATQAYFFCPESAADRALLIEQAVRAFENPHESRNVDIVDPVLTKYNQLVESLQNYIDDDQAWDGWKEGDELQTRGCAGAIDMYERAHEANLKNIKQVPDADEFDYVTPALSASFYLSLKHNVFQNNEGALTDEMRTMRELENGKLVVIRADGVKYECDADGRINATDDDLSLEVEHEPSQLWEETDDAVVDINKVNEILAFHNMKPMEEDAFDEDDEDEYDDEEEYEEEGEEEAAPEATPASA